MNECPGDGWFQNLGQQPSGTKGKRVVVVLRNGNRCGEKPVSAATPPGWTADTTRWTLTGDPFDVEWFKVL